MKITIIPHNTANVKTMHLSKTLIVLLLILLLIPLIARFLYPKGSLDSSQLEEYNKQLEQNLQNYDKEYSSLSDKYNNLLSKASASGNFNKASGSARTDGSSLTLKSSNDIDRLLEELQNSKTAMGKVESKLQSEQMLAEYIPSILPTQGCIVQPYGKTNYIFTGEERISQGIDISAPQGSKVCATAGGTIEFASLREHSGLMIVIDHGYGLKTVYSHLGFLKVSKNQTIKRGDEIGFVGKTGNAIGHVLHYEVWLNDEAKNPLDYVLQPVEYF